MIDFAALHRVPDERGRPPRILDVACGTGILLKHLLERVPGMEAYGVDASADMLAQAQEALKEQPHVRLERIEVNDGGTAGLPFSPGTFDLITCTNALHDIRDPVASLSEMRRLLAPGGQLVLEDFARRRHASLWAMFEWLVRRVEEGHGRAYTLAEARGLCTQAGLHVAYGKAYSIDWFWRGWVLRVDSIVSVC